MGLFRKKRLLSNTEAGWITDQYAEFMVRFGRDWAETRRLVLPTRDFFDAPKGNDHTIAAQVFDQVKAHMGLGSDWPVRLEPHEEAPRSQAVADAFLVRHDTMPVLGTFRVDENGPLITYDPDLPSSPRAFIATMAHELAHFMMLATVTSETQNNDPMIEEILTDILVIVAGFGVLSLESAFTSEAFGDAFAQGWSASHRGYISPETAAFTLGLFLRHHQIGIAETQPHLSSINAKRLKRALGQIDTNPELIPPIGEELGATR